LFLNTIILKSENILSFKYGYSVPFFYKSEFNKAYFKLLPSRCVSINYFYKLKKAPNLIFGIGIGTNSFRFNAVNFIDDDIKVNTSQRLVINQYKLFAGYSKSIGKINLYGLPYFCLNTYNVLEGKGKAPFSNTENIDFVESGKFYQFNNISYGLEFSVLYKLTKNKKLGIAFDFNTFNMGKMDYSLEVTKNNSTTSMYGFSNPVLGNISLNYFYSLNLKKK